MPKTNDKINCSPGNRIKCWSFQKKIYWGISLLLLVILGSQVVMADNKHTVGTFIAPYSPYGIYKKTYGDAYPYKMLIKDAAKQGISDIHFALQDGRGGPFLYKTKVKHAVAHKRMGERDYLDETLREAEKYGMRVILNFTTPYGNYPGTDFHGLNHPEILKLYENIITDICERYKKYKSLAGFEMHELNNTEVKETHTNKREEFSAYCQKEFGEKYSGAIMPPKTDPADKWWRRYALYKCEIMNNFSRMVKRTCHKYGLECWFCYYDPERAANGWRWGYDIIELEKICDKFTCRSGNEKKKVTQNIKGMAPFFGISYTGANVPREITYAFHGKPVTYFEFRNPNYMKAMRKHYSSSQKFTERYGDFYTGYSRKPEKVLAIFFGQENVKKWLNLISSWEGGRSPANIAVAQTSVPFYLKYPHTTGSKYTKQVSELMSALTKSTDIDAVMMNSIFALQPEKLLRYGLIIIPEDIGSGLSKKMVNSLRTYIRKGGKLLVVASPLLEAKKDLTNVVDVTEEFCGLKILKNNAAGGYVKAESKKNKVPNKKFWCAGCRNIKLTNAEVLVREKFSNSPILTKKGNVYYSAIGFTTGGSDYFNAILKEICKSPIELEQSAGIRIVEAVLKNNALCLAFFEQGKGKLKIDIKALGLRGKQFQVKNIITGAVLYELDAAVLAKGVEVEIKHVDQPYVLTVAPAKDLLAYRGIVPASETFENMATIFAVENPEVALAVPDLPGIKVGIYKGIGAIELLKLLEDKKGMNPFMLPRLDEACLKHCEVIIIPQVFTPAYFKQAEKIIRNSVRNGKGILLTHHMVISNLFPEIGKGGPKARQVPVSLGKNSHPILAGLEPGKSFEPGFMYDHITIVPNKGMTVIVEDSKVMAVMVAGKFGKGRVILNGMVPGLKGTLTDSAGKPGKPSGVEEQLLINSIKWLAKKK